MAADILGERLDRRTSTPWVNGWKEWMPQVLSIITTSPVRMRDRGQRRDVLHLERVAAGAFGIQYARFRPDQAGQHVGRVFRIE